MKNNNFLRVIFSFVVWVMIASFLSKFLVNMGISPVIAFVSLLAVTVLSVLYRTNSTGVVRNAVDAEIWVREIIKRLWKNNAFLSRAFNEDSYVLGGAVVHIINPGGAANVVKNRSVFPGVAARRTDTDVTYTLGDYSTDPIHIPDVELATITYDKTSSIIQDLFGYLMQYVADDQLVNWMQAIPAVNIVPTTGPITAALEAGQAGNRLAMVWQNLRDAGRIMSKTNVSKNGRVALIEENMYQQLVDSLAATQYKDFTRGFDEREGVLGRLFGFDIMTRSSVAMAAAGAGPLSVNAVGAAIGASDNVACICYQEETVSRALGTVEMYQRAKDPLYYGDIFSTRLRMGGRRRRGDDLGVVAIVQAPDAGV